MSTAQGIPVLEVRNAYKHFGAVSALDDVSFEVHEGEIVALLGDNGAGKSTLIKAVSGVHSLDEGEIFVDGAPVDIKSPKDARRLGIETVYQDLALFDNLSPIDNFFAGRELRWPAWLGGCGMLQERKMIAQWQDIADRLQVRIKDPKQPLGLMSGGQRQAVAVARAVTYADKIVILDEPTAALGLRESNKVLEIVERLPRQGVSVVLISHNLEEVMRVADRAVVMRQGQKVGEAIPHADNHHALVSMIVGAQAGTA